MIDVVPVRSENLKFRKSRDANAISCLFEAIYPQILKIVTKNGKESTVNRALGGSTYPG